MQLLEDLKSGKYNLVLILILFVFVFHQYWTTSSKEHMADTDMTSQIKDAIKQVYNADVESIRNLSEVATKLQTDGLTIPGNLKVSGTIEVGSDSIVRGNSTVVGTFNYLPAGTVVAWTGAVAPSGWALCDGKNNTPDLRGRFILGAGQTDNMTNSNILFGATSYDKAYGFNLGETGGENKHTLIIAELPTHTHTMATAGSHNHMTGGNIRSDMTGTHYSDIIQRTRTGITTDNAGDHIHTINNTGSGLPHNNMPPYWALAYIVKL